MAILTGGAGLLGREYAHGLAEAGAHVVVADINSPGAERLAAEVTEQTAVVALAVQTNVSSEPSVQALVARTMAAFGQVDILVNNAALDPKFDPEHAGEHVNAFEDYPLLFPM